MTGKYEKRGVSASKKEVHAAISRLDKGIFPDAFCKVLPDLAAGDPLYVNIMHADTAGTKTALAYLYWRETGDIKCWRGISQDAIVMNLDDIACAGGIDQMVISSTIGRNKNLIPGEVIREVIEGTEAFINSLKDYGIKVTLAGGETADVGDIVRTIDVGITAFCRLKKEDVVRINIREGDVIVGLASSGQAVYENKYNSGIGSNGLTFARHELLAHQYASLYPESFDPNLDSTVVYTGKMKLTDRDQTAGHTAGELLLSPTRTYLPVLREILGRFRQDIHGIIHCTGGGQTKVLHFASGLRIIKDELFAPPPVFNLIQKQTGADWKEMYQVFNMGHRLEVYLPAAKASEIIAIAGNFGIDAKIIGRVEGASKTEVVITTDAGEFHYFND